MYAVAPPPPALLKGEVLPQGNRKWVGARRPNNKKCLCQCFHSPSHLGTPTTCRTQQSQQSHAPHGGKKGPPVPIGEVPNPGLQTSPTFPEITDGTWTFNGWPINMQRAMIGRRTTFTSVQMVALVLLPKLAGVEATSTELRG